MPVSEDSVHRPPASLRGQDRLTPLGARRSAPLGALRFPVFCLVCPIGLTLGPSPCCGGCSISTAVLVAAGVPRHLAVELVSPQVVSQDLPARSAPLAHEQSERVRAAHRRREGLLEDIEGCGVRCVRGGVLRRDRPPRRWSAPSRSRSAPSAWTAWTPAPVHAISLPFFPKRAKGRDEQGEEEPCPVSAES